LTPTHNARRQRLVAMHGAPQIPFCNKAAPCSLSVTAEGNVDRILAAAMEIELGRKKR
jgi:hypothetical protein